MRFEPNRKKIIGATFSDFIETRLSNYKPLAIRNHFPLFWRIFFQLDSNLISHQVVPKIEKCEKMREKLNPFHARFTLTQLAKLINI